MRNSTTHRIAVTMGDVNGVGPEVIAKAFARPTWIKDAAPIVIGCTRAYESARTIVSGALPPVSVASPGDFAPDRSLAFLGSASRAPDRRPGQLDAEAGRAAMEWLAQAVDLAMNGTVDAIVTCPIHKEGIHRAGYTCRGHTDFIAQRTGSASYRMTLYVRGVFIVHLTDHLPLRQALDAVTEDRIVETAHIAHDALCQLGSDPRRIAVAGLNPHAGEAGAFGVEEQDVIAPAVARCRADGLDCSGPHSPDAVFRQALNGAFEAVVALYHDQGHIPMKLVAMDDGVNVTLGVPIVRTSVDHGTAYDIAGTGTVRENSFIEAYRLAARMVSIRKEARR